MVACLTHLWLRFNFQDEQFIHRHERSGAWLKTGWGYYRGPA